MPSLLGAVIAIALSAAPGPDEAALTPPRYVVERIEFHGLERTREDTVRKHLAVREGEVLDEERVLVSRLRLAQLRWFASVETHVERGSARGLVVLVFDVTERNTLSLSELFIGSTEAQTIYGGFGLAEQNAFGRGIELHGAFVYGGSPAQLPLDPARFSVRADLRLAEVNLGLPSRVSLGVSSLWIRGEEFACLDADCGAFEGSLGQAPRLRYERAGGGAEASVRVGPFSRIGGGIRAEHVEGDFRQGRADPASVGALPPLRLGSSTLVALTATYLRDSRDDVFFPTDGTRLELRGTLGTRALGGDYEYSRWSLDVETDFGVWRGHALRLLASAGVVQGDAPFFERFYAADLAYFSIGPALGRALELNFSTDPRYDAVAAMAGLEYGIPLWRGGRILQRGYLALGARWVHTTRAPGEWARTPLSRSPLSAETALRVDTPVGVFNLSAGYALDNGL
ncbi:MAG TPA: BamA/TamA family outer membrane protein [Anaeromyxobacteraceae bacterium]|nr:BamA/TamA family outer membrane protein [Anaeromyxobacteraceae bacterium]